MATAEMLRPVSREQAILESFFAQLGMFSFDRAKDYVEKEKDCSSRSGGAVWAALLAALAHLAAAEKAYHNMTFLGHKMGGQSFFSRKDSTRTIYTSLHNELRKAATSGRHGQPGSASAAYLEELLCHLAEQLCHFAQARVDMADLYEKMHALAAQKNVNGEALAAALEAVLHKYSSKFHHPILGRLEESFQTEVDVVSQLLRCQGQVSEWRFLPALLSLHGAAAKLAAWGQLFQRQKETRKHLFGGQSHKSVQPPHLYAWLQRFQAALLAKFSFYFHEALSRQTGPAEMRALTARAAPDYHGKICSFVRKHDAGSVSLVFDTRGSESFQGHGYRHPHAYREAPKGVEQFPAVVSLPSGERPLTHWPNVVMMMGDRAAELDAPDKVVHFYDDKVQSTYYLARPEPHFTLVVILDGRKSDKDLSVVAFLQEMCGSLRNSKPFGGLKPGSKG